MFTFFIVKQLRDIAELVQSSAHKESDQIETSVANLIDVGQGDSEPSAVSINLINFDESLAVIQRDLEPPALRTTDENGFSWLKNGNRVEVASNDNLLQMIEQSYDAEDGATSSSLQQNESAGIKDVNISALITAMLSSLSWMEDEQLDQMVKYFESSLVFDETNKNINAIHSPPKDEKNHRPLQRRLSL